MAVLFDELLTADTFTLKNDTVVLRISSFAL
jgi:hypothetical protein